MCLAKSQHLMKNLVDVEIREQHVLVLQGRADDFSNVEKSKA